MRLPLLDLRFALRCLQRRRTLTAARILTLALGVGASAALLAVFDAVAMAPLAGIPDADRVVDVQALYNNSSRGAMYPADFLAWRNSASHFVHFGAYLPLGSVAWTGDGPPRQLARFAITGGYLQAWGTLPRLGRAIESKDLQSGAPRVAVISYALWQGALAADPAVLGRVLILDGQAHEVVGVMPAGFVVRGGEPDVFLPWDPGPGAATDRTNAFLGGIARLRPGSTLAAATLELEAAVDRLAAAGSFGSRTPIRPDLLPITELMRGHREAFPLLLAAVLMLLALVILSCSQLQLAAARARAREMSIRACLGAGRGRRSALMLIEGALLALLALPLGTLLAAAILRALPDLGGRLTYRALPPAFTVGVLAVSALGIVLVALGATILPAWRAANAGTDPRLAMASGGGGKKQGSELLVAAQIAIAFVSLTGAGLLIRGTAQLLRSDLGFETAQLLQAEITLPASRYPSAEAVAAFYPRLLEAVRARAEVRAASAALYSPGGGWGFRPALDGDTAKPRSENAAARFVTVTSGYFDTVGLRLIAGRAIDRHDTEDKPLVAVLSLTAANRLYGLGDSTERSPGAALGHRLELDGRWHEVVGVVSDVRRDPFGAEEATVYLPHAQTPTVTDAGLRTMFLLARGRSGPAALAASLRDAVDAVDPLLPLDAVITLDQRVGDQLVVPRLQRLVMAVVGSLGLALAALGLYGLLRAHVGERQRELGIRIAVGARARDVQRLVLHRGLRLAILGLLLGCFLAVAAGRLLAHAFWGLSPYDLLTWTAVAAVLLIVTFLATWLPARRATRVDPQLVLRSE